jgi:hypothetical protein
LLRRQFNFDNPRKRYRMVKTVRAIIEDEQISIQQRGRSMLAA